uniref:threonine--tRNA ligase n=1 Tax=Timema douglasi TaxID=61478 RepID=A0A7R8VP23_TIMDO|nr:unnamed protein product [Timema douglasi]
MPSLVDDVCTKFGDLRSNEGVNQLDKFLADRSYVEGFSLGCADFTVFEMLGQSPKEVYPNVCRWYRHIASYKMNLKDLVPVVNSVKSHADLSREVKQHKVPQSVQENTPNTEKVAKVKKVKDKKEKTSGEKTGVSELKPWPSYIQERIVLWDKLKANYEAEIDAKTPETIKITLPDGKIVDGQSWRTTPYDVAKGISQGLADNAVISKVNGTLWDLDRPLEGDSKLQLLKFDDNEGML